MVDAAVGGAARRRHPVRRDCDPALHRRCRQAAHPRRHQIRQGPGAQGRRSDRLGFAGHHRICRRTVSRREALAAGPCDPRPCALGLGGNAFVVRGVAPGVRHEPAPEGRGQAALRRGSGRYRAHPGDLDRLPRPLRRAGAVPVRRVQRRRRHVCSGGAPVAHLCDPGHAAGARLYGHHAGAAGVPAMDRGGARRDADDRALRERLSPLGSRPCGRIHANVSRRG